MKYVSRTSVNQIAALADPELRNYLITESYHHLSLRLSTRLGGVANWCTFATWASRQAGQTIRGEDFDHWLSHQLPLDPAFVEPVRMLLAKIGSGASPEQLRSLLDQLIKWADPQTAMQYAAKAVAAGNQKVYAEIAIEFARFIESCMQDTSYRVDEIERFCAALKPGDAPEGQTLLAQAFNRYYLALFEQDPHLKAQLIYTANLEIGFHEQIRLQPEIASAMSLQFIETAQLKAQIRSAFLGRITWWQRMRQWIEQIWPGADLLEQPVQMFMEQLTQKMRQFLTKQMMELALPTGHIRLGQDLDYPYPPALEQVSYPDLQSLLGKIIPTPSDGRASGAVDWADLQDRLHFIAELFRRYQERPELLAAPFDREFATNFLDLHVVD